MGPSIGNILNIFKEIQKKNSFNRIKAMVGFYVHEIGIDEDKVKRQLSDKEKELYEL